MSLYYIGLDTSTSSTGFAIIDFEGKLIHYECIRTKEDWTKSLSLGAGYKLIDEAYNKAFYKIAQEIYKKDNVAKFVAGIECNTVMNGFGKGIDTTMKLGVTVGLAISNLIKNFCMEDIKLSAVGNWRNQIIHTTNANNRDELKLGICNWVETQFGIHLPLFPHESEGIKTADGYRDCRNNDIADAIGLAWTTKNDLLSDRKTLKIEMKRQDKQIRSWKLGFDTEKKKYEALLKLNKKVPSKDNLKKLNNYVINLKKYYNMLREQGAELERHTKFIEKLPKEIDYDANKI